MFADLQAVERLIELLRQSIEPHDVVITILPVQQPVRIRHERRKLVLDSEELINGIIMPLPLLAFGLYLQKPIEHMRRKLLRRRLAIGRIFAKLRQIALPPVEFASLMRGRFVVELSIVTCDPELLHQTERGEYLRVIEENFGKDLLVKQIQTPWPEPN